MVKADWNQFRAKFSSNPQDAFEWFASLLFCREFGRTNGIFRYKNQAGIETDPVVEGARVIGFQAKFYDSTLSEHKSDLLDCLNTTNRRYSNVNELHIYSNQDWGQGKDENKPKAQIDFEEAATKHGITIVYKLASFFESETVALHNKEIASHFFSIDRSAIDIVHEIFLKNSNILQEIQHSIPFGDSEIKLDRSNLVESIHGTKSPFMIIAGDAGTGKTAIIKEFAETRAEIPLIIFKAQEFSCIAHPNDLLGGFSYMRLFDLFKDHTEKIIIVDSAERLLDIQNKQPFQLLLKSFQNAGWQIVFTSRTLYAEDLEREIVAIHSSAPQIIRLVPISEDDLIKLAEAHQFQLPADLKLKQLLQTPLYLRMYLKWCSNHSDIDYAGFKHLVWKSEIGKSPRREQLFLNLIRKRLTSHSFFVTPDCEHEIAEELRVDGILGYEHAGYFITHDIYEEWGLGEIIKHAYSSRTGIVGFLNTITSELPIRRAFRQWVFDLIITNDSHGMDFVYEIMTGVEIEEHWRDEMIIAVLRSNNAQFFFENYKDQLLENNQRLLRKIIFLLRTTCKQISSRIHALLGDKQIDLFQLRYVMTEPYGSGWGAVIQFAHDNLEVIGIENISFVLPVISEWNQEYRRGKTTRLGTTIALKYYLHCVGEDTFFRGENDLFVTIANGVLECKGEIATLFKTILNLDNFNRRSSHSDFIEFVMTKSLAAPIAYVLPEYVIQLAWKYWGKKPSRDHYHGHEVDEYYGLISHRFDTHPSSAYQTPILPLLYAQPVTTIDFICAFTNKCIEQYQKTGFDKSLIEVQLIVEGQTIRQFASSSQWSMYRGTSSYPVTPSLLQCIHMALEKFLLEEVKAKDVLEAILLRILKHSKSVSLTAVVSSIVLARQEELFNVAEILFKVKEFFQYDFIRSQQELHIDFLLHPIPGAPAKEPYDSERSQSAKLPHRKNDLQWLILRYQLFREEGTTDEESERRQKVIWAILDGFYAELPPIEQLSEQDKGWLLTLTKMDRRKLMIETKERDDGIEFSFTPDLPQSVSEHSQKAQAEIDSRMKYTPLLIWATNRLDRLEPEKLTIFDGDPMLALQQVKEIITEFEQNTELDEDYALFNRTIPQKVCTLLIRDYSDILGAEDFEFCVNIQLGFASTIIRGEYTYQVSDGMNYAIWYLPEILKRPEGLQYKEEVKFCLLWGLFRQDSLSMLGGDHFYELSCYAIGTMWADYPSDVIAIIWGHCILHDKYNKYWKSYQRWNRTESDNISNQSFIEENESLIESIIKNEVVQASLPSLDSVDLHVHIVALKLISIQDFDHAEFYRYKNDIILVISAELFRASRSRDIDYKIRHDFYELYATNLLRSKTTATIDDLLQPFLSNFQSSELFSDLFTALVRYEDKLNRVENFWYIWNKFKPLVIQLCQAKGHWNDEIVKSYLFATVSWKERTVSWHSIQNRHHGFFQDVCDNLSNSPAAFYSISKVLFDVGRPLLRKGVFWLSRMVQKNADLIVGREKQDCIYYLENILRVFIYEHREEIRRTPEYKVCLIRLLDTLIKHESVVGFMLRESIL
jgi:hypothetical protein